MTSLPQRTRQQEALLLALRHIEAVQADGKPAVDKIYGGLCHKLPIQIRVNGLCQTIAFIESKRASKGDRGQAYTLLRAHMAAQLGIPENDLLARVRDAALPDYIYYSRRLLDSWIFYKRFAVAILKVESADQEEGKQ